MNVSVTHPFSLGSEILIKITNTHSAGRKNGSALPSVSISIQKRTFITWYGSYYSFVCQFYVGAVAELQLVYLLVNLNLHLHFS